MPYQKVAVCKECGQTKSCLWSPNGGPGQGDWRCFDCANSPNDLLSDLVKTITVPHIAAVAAVPKEQK